MTNYPTPLGGVEFAPDPKFMRRAIELSRLGMQRGDGGPFGAVIVRDGNIVAEGWNRVIATNDPTAHGEILAIRDACSRLGSFTLAGCDLYTSSEPCPMCLSAVYWSRLDRIIYANTTVDATAIGFDDTFILKELQKSPALRRIPTSQLMRDEAIKVFREFAANPNRVRY